MPRARRGPDTGHASSFSLAPSDLRLLSTENERVRGRATSARRSPIWAGTPRVPGIDRACFGEPRIARPRARGLCARAFAGGLGARAGAVEREREPDVRRRDERVILVDIRAGAFERRIEQ